MYNSYKIPGGQCAKLRPPQAAHSPQVASYLPALSGFGTYLVNSLARGQALHPGSGLDDQLLWVVHIDDAGLPESHRPCRGSRAGAAMPAERRRRDSTFNTGECLLCDSFFFLPPLRGPREESEGGFYLRKRQSPEL